MSTIRTNNFGPLSGNTASVYDPATPSGGSASLGPKVLMSAQNLSGTSVDFTNIPIWVKRVTVIYANAQKSGSTNNLLQIGTNSGLETTGYVSRTAYAGTSGYDSITSTSGFVASAGDAASTCQVSCIATIINITGNQWVFSVTGSRTESSYGISGGGNKTLSGTLSRVRFTTISGTDTYSGGNINIMYE